MSATELSLANLFVQFTKEMGAVDDSKLITRR